MTVSLVMAYWDRAAATDKALALLAQHYADMDLEVIIVDDGSEEAYRAPKGTPWPVIVVRLPWKSAPKNPCLPLNIGAHLASGKYIALTCPEILHQTPVLPGMLKSVESSTDYVIAACWAPETRRWHAHSSRSPLFADRTEIRMPEGSQYHFLALMSRELWKASGGFDNEYRDGAGYDDNDLLMRLACAGARFVMRDDLVVEHPRAGARAAWTAPMYARNRELFMSKWA